MINIESVEQYCSEKIINMSNATKLIESFRNMGKTIGLCHGGFDLLHPGHIKHFESAKKLCDVLVVSITSDKFVSSRKGTGRPIYPDKLRSYMVACIEYVDYVVVTDFEKGIDIIKSLKPTYYIKGPDYINKTTPGITAEREAIKNVGGEMKYTNDPTFSTTKIIDYIKNKMDIRKILIVIDRDGTLIEDAEFLGRNKDWKKSVRYRANIISLLSYLQTKYNTTKIVVSNQAGVARGYFDCKMVEEINKYINSFLKEKCVKIDNWQYCPDVDSSYAEQKKNELKFNPVYIKDKTKRKPSTEMVLDAMHNLDLSIEDFNSIVVIGDKEDDRQLAQNLKAKYVDANGNYDELVKETKEL